MNWWALPDAGAANRVSRLLVRGRSDEEEEEKTVSLCLLSHNADVHNAL